MLADFKLPTTFWAEAVNIAYYVQNRVLVVKPYNKTPYELFHGRTPTLSFMRPFGCQVTILNTLDHLGKFDGKVDEGFFVRYSLNSKAFRVFNSRTRIVEENLHISGSTSNVVGSGPNWLFDIDALTRTISHDDGSKPSSDDEKKVDEDLRKESKCKDQEKNKKNERRIVIRNKAILVAQRHTQEEGIDYDEVFGPVARIKAIRLFLAYASLKDFVVYQMDVKSAFLYGKIEEEVYICQPLRFEDPDFPDRVYKVEKSLYGLHQAPRACDYAGASLDRKSTTGGCQFLGCRLISWQCKKQIVVANSTTEATYVATSSYLGHVLWIQNQLLDYGDCNEKKLIQMIKIHTDKNVVDLLTKAFDFWSTSKAKTINEKAQIHAKVDGKKIIITESSVRRDLRLADEEIQNQAEMGQGSVMPTDPQHTPTILQPLSSQPQKTHKPKKPKQKNTQVPQLSDPTNIVTDEAIHKELGNILVRAATTASILEVERDSGNILKTQSKATPNDSSS
nr:retrovirus-related Pol polyprotein from transposon TNT 1-94 [Tanacetum cinerariifolium]